VTAATAWLADGRRVHEHVVVGGAEVGEHALDAFGGFRCLRRCEALERSERGVGREFTVRGRREVTAHGRGVGVVGEERGGVGVDASGDVLGEPLRGERGVEDADARTVAGEQSGGLDAEACRARAAGDTDERGSAWLHALCSIRYGTKI